MLHIEMVIKMDSNDQKAIRKMEYIDRLASFSKWSLGAVQSPVALAKAGFFWTGVLDVVKCASCHCIVRDWCRKHCPLQRHIEQKRDCMFLHKTLGGDFLHYYKSCNSMTIERFMCRLCRKREACIAFLPCGHTITCIECAAKIQDYCPVCILHIYNRLRIYLS